MTLRGLIINVDDIGIHEGAVEAAVETITDGVAASGSVMTVCSGTAAALDLLTTRPDVPVGVHLTLTRDFPESDWAPFTRGRSIQDQGRFVGIEYREQLLAQADAHEVKAEFRAQVEVALDAGLQPTHLDWHCLADGGREDIFDLTLALAEEYQIGIRAWTDRGRHALRSCGRVAQNRPFLDSFAVPLNQKQEYLLSLIRALPRGLSEWAMHPARPTAMNGGCDVRSTDHDVLMSPTTRRILHDEAISVLGYGSPTLVSTR